MPPSISLTFRRLLDALVPLSGQGRAARGGPAPTVGVYPVQPYEELILRALREHGDLALGATVDRVADEAMLAEQRRGAWVSDIGIWGPALFRREVLNAVCRMVGRSLVLEGDLEGPWLVAPVEAK